MNVIFILKIAIALAGLTVPGYTLAKALRLKESLAAAFPFSALLICQSVVLLTCLGWSISFRTVAPLLILSSIACALITLRRSDLSAAEPKESESASRSDIILFRTGMAAALLLLLAVAFRTTLYPLGGFDTFTRWDALARAMLQHSSLFFYPPLTAGDFTIYPMPDGFPPLVASIYWWIYAATGSSLPQLTALSVTLQLASLLGLARAAAATAFGKKAAAFTLLALAASPLLIRSVQIGQESGFLAIAVAGQLCCALAAVRTPVQAPVYAAALFAALGASAREYGPALALPGLLILLSARETRRFAWRYLLLAGLAASPWYIRNWFITGSPLYPVMLPGSHHANQLLDALMGYYNEIFGIANFGVKEWLNIGYELITGATIAFLAGLGCFAIKGRRLYPYSLSLLLVAALWLWSVGKTSGGVIYSMRMLAPAIVILAIVAGKALAAIADSGWHKQVTGLLVPAALWGLLTALAFPQEPMQLPAVLLSTKDEAPEFINASREFAKRIDALDIPSSGILTDSPYLAVILKRETRLRPVIIWSSEVSAIISPEKSFPGTSQLLRDKGISLVAMSRSSIHNNLLFSTPFYRDGVNEWQELLQLGDWTLFAITPASGR